MKKNLIIIVALASALASCAPKQNPVADAIAAELERTVDGAKGVVFETIEHLDSVSLGQELDYREKLFRFKAEVLQRKVDGYKASGDRPHMLGAMKSLAVTEHILNGLPALRERQKDSLDRTVYHDWKFTATINTDKGKVVAKDWYACITPDMQVLTCVRDRKEIRNGAGKVIPGYMELIEETKEAK